MTAFIENDLDRMSSENFYLFVLNTVINKYNHKTPLLRIRWHGFCFHLVDVCFNLTRID